MIKNRINNALREFFVLSYMFFDYTLALLTSAKKFKVENSCRISLPMHQVLLTKYLCSDHAQNKTSKTLSFSAYNLHHFSRINICHNIFHLSFQSLLPFKPMLNLIFSQQANMFVFFKKKSKKRPIDC